MITDMGRSKRSARTISSRRTTAKCRALKSPVFGSTRASSWRAGTLSERWIRKRGATANGISQGLIHQNSATATPRHASTTSVVKDSTVMIESGLCPAPAGS